MAPAFRYILQPYNGRRSRATCPACGGVGQFARYLDTETGEPLPAEFGRCNRESNCGYHASPYAHGPDGESYAHRAALRTAAGAVPAPYAPATHKLTGPPPPPIFIPAELYQASLGRYERNNLARLLRCHFGAGVAAELLARFHVGTSAHWPGACVYWLIDECGQVRGGQVVLLDETGHTVKSPRRCTTWAHTALAHRLREAGQAPPAWLSAYEKQPAKSPCLFGLPQLETAPAGQPVAIVESAKTAILCTPYLPAFVWLATGGQSYLTPERLAPVKGRRVVLFPDAGSLGDWQARASKLRALGFQVEVSADVERLADEHERAAGLDLADVLLSEWPGYPPSWDAAE